MREEIYTVAAVFAGVHGEKDAALERLCEAARAEVTANLRRGVAPEECRQSLLCASAMLAASHYLAARGGCGVKSFTVGEVTVNAGEAVSTAADLRTQAELLMRPFCAGGFHFAGVRG